MGLKTLTLQASTGPLTDISFDIVPNKTLSYQFHRGSHTRMSQIMECQERRITVGSRNYWPRATLRHIAHDGILGSWDRYCG